jgi:hypothetical protein
MASERRSTQYLDQKTFSIEGRHLRAIEKGELDFLDIEGLGTLNKSQLDDVLMAIRAGKFHARGRTNYGGTWFALKWDDFNESGEISR